MIFQYKGSAPQPSADSPQSADFTAKEDVVILQDCLTPIESPDDSYLSSTIKIDISSIPDQTQVNSVSDGIQTVTFNIPLLKLTVPAQWSEWSSPPFSESATPPVLFTMLNPGPLELNLSVPASIFGIELEPNFINTFTFTAEFYSGDTLVGSITREVPALVRLFAGISCGPCIDRVVITGPPGTRGFAIAQIRYAVCLPRGVKLLENDIVM